MTPQYSVRPSPRFGRLARRLTDQQPHEFPAHYAEALEILGSDPTNRTRRFRIKKLVGVPAGEGQWRLALGRFRFRYDMAGSTVELARPAPKVRLRGGYLEAVIDDPKHSARQPLLWQNAFFGRRKRRMVRLRGWLRASNSPLYLNPHILDEVIKYVYLPPGLEREYRNLEGPN